MQSDSSNSATEAEDVFDVRLTAIRYLANETHLFEFARPDGGVLPPAEAGSHIDLHLPNGLVRQYSLVVGDPAPRCYKVGIKRDGASRGGSRYIHDSLRVGTVLKISAPRNNFALVEDAPHVVLVAGGIGITPIRAMVRRLEDLGRPWSLFYAARSRADAAFYDELSRFDQVTFSFDDETGGKFLDMEAVVASGPEAAHFYCCGPAAMLGAFEAATAALAPERVHVEYFTAKHEAAVEGGFIVELAKSGQEFVVPPGKSILDVLIEAGVDVTYSCTEGICGACETRVISGQPDHRDGILTPFEQEQSKTMMICCSGSKSERLVLDL